VFEKDNVFEFKETTHKINYSKSRIELHKIYAEVQQIRNGCENQRSLTEIFEDIKANHSKDWLCALDILEITSDNDLQKMVSNYLMDLSNSSEYSSLITDGINLLK
jgi:phenylalanine-4-hydroxylase